MVSKKCLIGNFRNFRISKKVKKIKNIFLLELLGSEKNNFLIDRPILYKIGFSKGKKIEEGPFFRISFL